eukprot:13018300-Alexandrium_andersonii.AAC.1
MLDSAFAATRSRERQTEEEGPETASTLIPKAPDRRAARRSCAQMPNLPAKRAGERAGGASRT